MGGIGTIGTVVWSLIVLAYNLANLAWMLVFNLVSSIPKLVFKLVPSSLRPATTKKGQDRAITTTLEDIEKG